MTLAARTQPTHGYYQTRDNVLATRSSKSLEYEIISRITYRLGQAARTKKTDYPGLVAALHENRRLWTVLAADLMDSDNLLPDDLRARLLYLAEFVSVHTGRVLSGAAKVKPLVDVNLAVLRGLKQPEETL